METKSSRKASRAMFILIAFAVTMIILAFTTGLNISSMFIYAALIAMGLAAVNGIIATFMEDWRLFTFREK